MSMLSPREKMRIKLLIHGAHRIINSKRKIESKYELVCFTKSKTHTFFGYYDISPFNFSNQLLYLELSEDESYANVVLNNVMNTGKKYIGKTYAWNWQQGCRLRWFPGYDNAIFYNTFENNEYGSLMVSTEGAIIKRYSYPLYDIETDGKYGLTLNFERLGYMRPGYGYTCRENEKKNIEKDSIKIIDLSSETVIEEITYKQIAEKMPRACSLENCYLNHLSFSPSGKSFLFFWIEIIENYHKASMMVYDMNSKSIIPLEVKDKVSHYVWLNNEEILCTVYDNPNECRYYVYNIKLRSKILFCPKSLKEDGHPSIYDEDYILTDTYPNKYGFQQLYMVNKLDDTKQTLVSIYSKPVTNGERRTDLHPRFNYDKSIVCFDSNKSGVRELFLFNIK